MRGTVAIIGGGVAGIAAATALADTGYSVQLLEKRPLLGGRASSFVDASSGMRLDECQHGTMRCCTNLTKLLQSLGVEERIHYLDRLEFLDGDGKRSVIEGCPLPAPAHTSLSFLRFGALNLRDKVGIARAFSKILLTKDLSVGETTSIGDWLKQMGQTDRAVTRFWRPILVSACNEELDRISCRHAFMLFRDGFLLHREAFHFGLPTVPLGSLYTEPTISYLNQRGGSVRTRTIVDQIHFDGGPNGRVTHLTLQSGETLVADHYIVALQCDLLLKLLPSEIVAGVGYWENLGKIELSPILGVHLWFDREVDCPIALAILDRDIEWIFNKNKIWDSANRQGPKDDRLATGTYLSVVISASARFEAMPKNDLLALVTEQVRECLPDAHGAELMKSLVIRWPKATISPKPGVESLRPSQQSPISNLYVAGEWTDTGWPSTMEGAARSGYLAAEYLMRREGSSPSLLAPNLPIKGIARLFA